MITAQDRPQRTVDNEAGADPDGSVTIAGPHGEVVRLNATAVALLELCDGRTTVAEMVTAATSLFSGEPDGIRRDIYATLEELRDQGLLA